MKTRTMMHLALWLLLAVLLCASPAVADEPDLSAQAALGTAFTYQGRLLDDNAPANGTYDFEFKLYDGSDPSTATQRGSTITVDDLAVTNGNFTVSLDFGGSHFNGQALWLQVGVRPGASSDPYTALSPLTALNAAPYALGLRPGARLTGTVNAEPMFAATNTGTGMAPVGVWGSSVNAAGVYGQSTHSIGVSGVGPVGVQGYSATGGVAIRASGTGVIQSTAKSYLWISGNSLQKADTNDTTRFLYDYYGGYYVYGGTDWVHNKTVVLPVTIPGQLYGQNVTMTGLRLYFSTSDDLTGITIVAMRRQNGVGAGDEIFRDDTDRVCPGAQCVQHWDLTTNNVLSDQRGIVYLAIQCGFAGSGSWVQIGGARLTLEHD